MGNPGFYKKIKETSLHRAGLIVWMTFLVCWVPTVQAEPDSCNPNQGKIARAMFTTDIVDREPIDRVLILQNDKSQLNFFTDLRNFEGQTINHRWEYEGQVVMTKSFEVKGPRWRVFSTLSLETKQTGRWTVVITEGEDCPIKAVLFRYVAKTEDGEATAIIDLKH
jgi:hypothetical protein